MSTLSPLFCLDDLVGLSRTDCECYPDVPEEEILSGLFIEDLVGLRGVSSLLNCEDGTDIWEYMAKARSLAITQFYTDFNALLMQHYKLRRLPYNGIIGKMVRGRYTRPVVGEIAMHRMFMADIVNGYFRVNKIGAIFDTTGTIDVTLADNVNGVIDTYTINTVAGVFTETAIDIELPTHNPIVGNIEYYWYYTMDAKQPGQVTLGCKCGGSGHYYDSLHPKFYSQTNKKYGYSNYMMVGSNKMKTLNWDAIPHKGNNMSYGLAFDVEMKCLTEHLLCQDFDFATNNLARSIALAIWYKAGANLAWRLTKGENLSRWSQVDHESLKEDAGKWEKKYNEMVNYIVDTIEIKGDDCFICRDTIGVNKRGIMA
jgi:hypothetical protein